MGLTLKCLLGRINTDCQLETADGHVLFTARHLLPKHKWCWFTLKLNDNKKIWNILDCIVRDRQK